jgi:hypothetical protein
MHNRSESGRGARVTLRANPLILMTQSYIILSAYRKWHMVRLLYVIRRSINLKRVKTDIDVGTDLKTHISLLVTVM